MKAGKLVTPSRAGLRGTVLALLTMLFVGLAPRLFYLLQASPFVDEYSTLMAVQGILTKGIPLLPSGFFYGHDLFYSYAATGAAILWPDDLAIVRFLSLMASLGVIVLTYWMGHRLFSAQAGLLAAAFLALSPQAVLWGARARAYALEQLLALVAFWLFYRGMENDRPLWRRLGLLALVAAVFTHPEAALLLPALALAVLTLEGLHWWLRLDRLIEFALAAAGVAGRYLLVRVLAKGEVGSFNVTTDVRPIFGFLINWKGGLETVGEFLFGGPMLLATILALLGILAMGLKARGDRRAYAARFLAITLAAILLQMALVIGGTWQSVRYLFFAAPFLFLLAGAGLEVLAEWLTPRLPRTAVGTIVAAVAIVALLPSVPAVVRAANTSEIAYDRAFDYVNDQWSPGDRLATLAPAAAWISLGQVHYFALGESYEEFVWQENGRWYDRWVGAPLIRTAPELAAALDEAEAAGTTLWLVTDESRLLKRYDDAFVQTIWDRMSLVHAEGRAQVFRSQPAHSYAVEVDTPRRETFAGRIALVGYAVGDPAQAGTPPQGALTVQPGQALPLRLDWQALSPLTDTYTVFVHVVAPDGRGYGQSDGPPLEGLYPMHLWEPGIHYPDARSLTLSEDLIPGRYRVEIGLYELAIGDRMPLDEGPGRLPGDALILDFVTMPGVESGSPSILLDAELGGAIRMLGISSNPAVASVHPGDKLTLTLYWQAIEPTEDAYTLFVHMVGADGTTLTQYDGQPQGGFYPTAFWDPGEQLEDSVTLAVPADALPGTYQLLAGLYLPSTGDRLVTTGADAGSGDVVLLGTVDVVQ